MTQKYIKELLKSHTTCPKMGLHLPAAKPVGNAEAKLVTPKLLGVARDITGVTSVATDDFPVT